MTPGAAAAVASRTHEQEMLNRIPVPAVFDGGEGEHGLDLREILSFAWRQWKFILGVAGIVLVIGIVSLLRQTPLYTATAQVMLDPQREKAPGTEAILSDAGLDYAVVENQMAIIRSTVFLRRVVEKEHLVADAEFGSGQIVTGVIQPLSAPFDNGRGRAAPPPPPGRDPAPEPGVGEAEHRAGPDAGVGRDDPLHFGRVDVGTAADDDQLLPVGDEHFALAGDPAQVPGA
jgi:hypothetical protein